MPYILSIFHVVGMTFSRKPVAFSLRAFFKLILTLLWMTFLQFDKQRQAKYLAVVAVERT